MKKIIFLIVFFLLMTGCTQTQIDQIKWSLSLDNTKDSVTYIMAEKFGQELDNLSNGKIKLTIYPNAVLGGDRESIESCQMGDITFVAQTTAPQVSFVPEVAVFDLFHIFPDLETARKVLDGDFLNVIRPYYQEKRLYILGYSDQHFREMTSNKKISRKEDIEGLKIRTMENSNHIKYWKDVGANPTPMAWGEVYIGLQQHSIDAQENPYESIVASKIYEQQKYVIETHHILHLVSLVMNNQIYDELDENTKSMVEEAAIRAIKYSRKKADERIAERKNIVRSSGVEIISLDEDTKEFMREKANGVNESIKKQVGNEIVDRLKSEIKRVQE